MVNADGTLGTFDSGGKGVMLPSLGTFFVSAPCVLLDLGLLILWLRTFLSAECQKLQGDFRTRWNVFRVRPVTKFNLI